MTETRTITITITASDEATAATASEDLIGHLYDEWASAHPAVKAELAVTFTNGGVYRDPVLVG
jgi:hypothetical protein